MSKNEKRIEKARKNLERVQKQAALARHDLIEQLKKTSKRLRGEVDSLEGEAQTRAERVAKDMEEVARQIEEETEMRLGKVRERASENMWTTLGIAFVVGLVIGILMRGE